MPHVTFVPMTGLRIRDQELAAWGMTLPGLPQRASALAQLPALGILTLAGMLPPGWTADYQDVGQADDPQTLAKRIAATGPDLVAVSALTASVLQAYQLCDSLRAAGIRTVIGGLHVTACPEEAAQHADIVVVGEGEQIWTQLLRDVEKGTPAERYEANEAFDLADSPLPAFELLGKGSRPRLTLQTQRGCPLACEFCGASRLLGRFREKPLANVRRELDALRRYSARPWLELADDNTFAGQRDCRALLSALRDADVRYFTESDWRIGQRPDLLADLAASGCVQVLVGIESLPFRFPGMGGKAAELSAMMEAVAAIQQAGVVVNGCFILGADGETEDSLDRLTEFLVGSPFAELQITLQTPFPGTALYRRLQQDGRLLPDRDWSHYTLFDVTYQPDCMSVAALESGFRRVLGSVFSAAENRRRQTLRRKIWRRGGQFARRDG